MTGTLTVAVLGTGTMGAPMARNLIEAGHAVRAWNRTAEKARRIEGAEAFDTPAEAARGADVVLTMLADGRAVEDTMTGALAGTSEGAVWLQMSTVGIVATERLAFAEAIDIDPQVFLETIDGSPVGPAYAQLKGKLMIEREFPPAFSLKLAHKDAELVLEAAERVGFDAALANVVDRKMEEAIEHGHGDEDMAATFYASAPGR